MHPNSNRTFQPHSTAPPTSPPLVSSALVQQPPSSSGSTQQSMDTLISVLQQGFARLEAKFDASAQRTASPSSRPPAEQPSELQGSVWVPPWPSGSLQTTATAVSTSPWEDTRRGCSGQQGGVVPRPYASQGPTAWDAPHDQHNNRTMGATHTAWDRPVVHRGENHGFRSSWEPNQPRGGPSPTSSEPSRFMRLDPPMFDGSDAQSWVTRVQYYFDYIMLPLDQRLHSVIVLFSPPASDWVFAYREANPHVSWPQFLDDVRRRFDPNYFVNYIEVLSKLTQTGSLLDYSNEFEKLMNRTHGLTESALIPMYIGGLRQPLRGQVRLQHPHSVSAAISLASEFDNMGERGNQAVNQASRRPWPNRDSRGSTSGATPIAPSSDASKPAVAVSNGNRHRDLSKLPIVRLSSAERTERSRQGLCWYCPEKWSAGHACKKPVLAYMGVDEEDEDIQPSGEDVDGPEVVTSDLSHLYSLDGRPRASSLEFRGVMGRKEVGILVDTGSTHNFVHPKVAESCCLDLDAVKPFRVYMGNGQSLVCSYASSGTSVEIQGHSFQVDLFVLPVHGQDVVLGMAWLRSLHRVTSDYDHGTLEFVRGGTAIRLKVQPRVPRQVSPHKFASFLLRAEPASLFEIVAIDGGAYEIPHGTSQKSLELPMDISPAVRTVLMRHAAVFSVPTGLPPKRVFDHRIHLLPNSKPVNVRPYRYPYFQKAEIERQVKEMLDMGIIRHSTSAFSSPVLLIRKKDGSFRFCIDYRALNTATVPDHFPIPTADELFDELGQARVFTKLDLRSGYHQIRMHDADVFKTAFRTHDGHFEFLVMPFGLTNAPSTFQAAMNDLFRPFLRRFVIVFFDDILIYSPSMDSHVEHLSEVLGILSRNNFFVKLSKCVFCSSTVDYLGHVITEGSLRADPAKIEAMAAWPPPKTVKQLRGFLGLTGYYRRFIAGYAVIAAPLTDLLKKDSFQWTSAAETSFTELKEAMTSAPVLALPDFSKQFIVETDASGTGVGAVLLQGKHPLTYFSKKLGPRRRVTSTYHKELYAIVEAVQKWRQYLLGREFIIRTDQKSLRELLQQVIQTPDQQLYARKLMGFKFVIEYKPGVLNKTADALSRQGDESTAEPTDGIEATNGDEAAATARDDAALFAAVAQPMPDVFEILRDDVRSIQEMRELWESIEKGTAPNDYQSRDGLIYRGRRVVVAATSAAKPAIMYEFHSTPFAGHPGVERTFRRLASFFYWPHMRREVKQFVAACFDCQTTKYSTQKPAGLLQPLPIPSQVWVDVSMDFITGLPQSRGSTVIMVVVDRFSKYAHFAPLPTRFDAWRVANAFVDNVVKHHGFPNSIVSDRDSVFVNEVWENLIRLSGTKLHFTTAYHPESDGQTEVKNRGLEQYLRAFVADNPVKWTNFLPWAELALNCFHHSGLGTSPFKALYGRDPPSLLAPRPSAACPASVAEVIRQRGELLLWLRRNLEKAQQQMRDTANRGRRDVEYKVGDRVLLKLQLYRQHSVAKPLSPKLARRYFGPFEVCERIGQVAYRLKLPEESRIHDVFHVSLLRPFVEGSASSLPPFPSYFARGRAVARPLALLDHRSVRRNGVVVDEGLISWDDDDGASPTWEPFEVIHRRFPDLLLADKERVNGEGVDTNLTPNSNHNGEEHADEVDKVEEAVAGGDYDTTEKPVDENGGESRSERPKRVTREPKKFDGFVAYR